MPELAISNVCTLKDNDEVNTGSLDQPEDLITPTKENAAVGKNGSKKMVNTYSEIPPPPGFKEATESHLFVQDQRSTENLSDNIMIPGSLNNVEASKVQTRSMTRSSEKQLDFNNDT